MGWDGNIMSQIERFCVCVNFVLNNVRSLSIK